MFSENGLMDFGSDCVEGLMTLNQQRIEEIANEEVGGGDVIVTENAQKRPIMSMERLNKVRQREGMKTIDEKAARQFKKAIPTGVRGDPLKRLNDAIGKIPMGKGVQRALKAAERATRALGPLGGIVIPPICAPRRPGELTRRCSRERYYT